MFTHLHLHTEYSLLDGLGKIEDYVVRAKELGMKSIAITDHGNGYGLVEFYNSCKKHGIKPILGCEVYVAPGSRFDKDPNKVRYYHLILLVKNDVGYKNLCYLITRSNTEGYYYKPRIDFELLKGHHEGLICLSGCVAGEVAKNFLNNNPAGAKECALRYRELFGQDYYLEIQNHGIKDESIAFHEIIKLSDELGIQLVVTNDCHYVNSEDAEAHEWLLCMQTGKTIDDPDHLVYHGNYSLRTEEEMKTLFPSRPEAVFNTQQIADKCNFEFHFAEGPADYRMPNVVIPESYGDDYFKYLSDEAYAGLDKRYPIGHAEREEAKEKLAYELSVIKSMGFAEYFLDTRKTILWSRKNGILVGPGRGSGAGSVVNYCLGITDIDPIRYGLLFERFLNPERISMPDIDVDYSYMRKNDVVRSEAESNGYERFAKIQTFGSMLAKGVLRDCARAAGFPPSIGNALAAKVPNELGITLSEAYEKNPELQTYLKDNPQLEKLWQIALKLEGTKKSAGSHACGHIPTPVPCEELFPCSVDLDTRILICQYNMVEAEHLGNLKKDLLMLRNLSIIEFAMDEVKRNHGIDIPLWTDAVLNDKEALAMISAGETKGVFQLESDGMTNFMKQLKPDCFEDIIAGVSLYRPGPMDFIPQYIEGKHHQDSIRYLTPELESILKPTYGVIVYQEQVMQIVQRLGGFTMGRADVVRKAMGKKKMDIMEAEGKNFIYGNSELGIPGCINNHIPEQTSRTLYDQMIDFAKYAFNKSHAAAYAAISMQTAYLKCHYPLEFMAGLLTSVMDNPKKLPKYIYECKQQGITILPPDVNKSEVGFCIEDGAIRFGLNGIKNVGEELAASLVAERKNHGNYTSFEDFFQRNTGLNSGACNSLALSGALSFTAASRQSLYLNIKEAINYMKDRNKHTISGQFSLFDLVSEAPFEMDNYLFPDIPEYSKQVLLQKEKEVLGIYLSGHPLDDYKDILEKKCTVTSLDFDLGDTEDSLSVSSGDEDTPSSNLTTSIRSGQNVVYGGMITEVRKIYTKKNEPMAFITVEDLFGAVPVVVFPRAYHEYQQFLSDDSKILLKGTVSIEDGKDPSILVDEISDLSDSGRNLWLRFNSMADMESKYNDVEDIINSQAGHDTLIYYVAAEKQKRIRQKCVDAESAQEIFEKLLGYENVVLK